MFAYKLKPTLLGTIIVISTRSYAQYIVRNMSIDKSLVELGTSFELARGRVNKEGFIEVEIVRRLENDFELKSNIFYQQINPHPHVLQIVVFE